MAGRATVETPAAGITVPFFQLSITVTIYAIDPWNNWDRDNAYFHVQFNDGIMTPITTDSNKVKNPYKKIRTCYENTPA